MDYRRLVGPCCDSEWVKEHTLARMCDGWFLPGKVTESDDVQGRYDFQKVTFAMEHFVYYSLNSPNSITRLSTC